MLCPDCHGDCTAIANQVVYKDGSKLNNIKVKCYRCHGSGAVPDEMAQWIIDGRKLYNRRVHEQPYRTLAEEAQIRNILMGDLADMERGMIPPFFPE